MMHANRKKIIAGNWKMNKTGEEARDYIEHLKAFLVPHQAEVLLAVPFTAISVAREAAKGSSIKIGAQNMNAASSGAFTGEIAARMLIEAGAEFVLLGHSERRQLFHETDEIVNNKLKRALEENLTPIVCLGETLGQRETDLTELTLERQIKGSFKEIIDADMSSLIIAYEPVWAIGTGKTASPQEAQQAHHFIRQTLAKNWSEVVAEQVPILYGGSATPGNARELLKEEDVDGLLVGGASLQPETFAQIIEAQSNIPQL